MSTERPTQSDKELWRSLVADRVASGPVSDLDFAAWLEGRLSETAAARIEAAVAADPEVAVLVKSCGGKTTLRDHARRIAAKRHVPVSYVLPALVTVAKPLIEYGFLLPIEIASKLDL